LRAEEDEYNISQERVISDFYLMHIGIGVENCK
jgi:hypothetical protein